jgi:hypothetical protein
VQHVRVTANRVVLTSRVIGPVQRECNLSKLGYEVNLTLQMCGDLSEYFRSNYDDETSGSMVVVVDKMSRVWHSGDMGALVCHALMSCIKN